MTRTLDTPVAKSLHQETHCATGIQYLPRAEGIYDAFGDYTEEVEPVFSSVVRQSKGSAVVFSTIQFLNSVYPD